MPFFAKRSEAPSPEPLFEGDVSTAPVESGMSPMLAKVLGMLGFDPQQLQEMSEKTALVVKDAQERLTRIEAKLDELLTERRAVHAALQNGKAEADKDDARA